ncbi:MAG: (deoxy)nucleoside triphosphate pyrophosphohydrolase [Treponema sp.]|jgi:8-oxo-dGTP diphosphatase|nr:(deoxy)nucleoside triphosphate pyrophosphohydrolase [Treponema sp.]
MAATQRSVAGIALENGKLFIAKRVQGGAMGGKWEFPGGKVEEGESDEQALAREYAEEFGVEIAVGQLVGCAAFEHKGPRHLAAYRVALRAGAVKLVEHTEVRWVTLAEIEALDFADSDRALLPSLRNAHLGA